MNPKTAYEYISTVYRSSRQHRRLDERSFDILEQFIWEKYLSAYQICSRLKSTPRKLAYKNVNLRTNQLLSSDLIQKVETDSKNSKHNAIHYRLTECGIYQLFLNRLRSIAPNSPFLRNYSDSALFKVFVYPYFKKETLLAIGPSILWWLYNHLSTCCQSIESEELLKNSDFFNSTGFSLIFLWNEVPGKDNGRLLDHLQKVFKLESIDRYDIKKEDAGEYPTITVNIPSAPTIMIKLDKARDKVLIMSTAGGQFKNLQYEFRHVDQWVAERLPKEAPIAVLVSKIFIKAGMGIEQIIYDFVYQLASEAETRQEEYSYYTKILSQDDRFMKVVKEIYENRHKEFERGYKRLTTNS